MEKIAFTKDGATKMIDIRDEAQTKAVIAAGWASEEKPTKSPKKGK